MKQTNNTTLDDVAAIIGFSATLRLAAWYGNGNTLYVPATVSEGQMLVKLIGMSSAKRLSEEWPGELIAIPSISAYEVDLKKRQVCRMLEQKFGTREIAVFLKMSERRVSQIAAELEESGFLTAVVGRKTTYESAEQKSPQETVQENAQAKSVEENGQKNEGEKTVGRTPLPVNYYEVQLPFYAEPKFSRDE
jgi:hypothetical protein